MLFAVLGCSGQATEDDILYIALETSPNKLDPAFVVDVAEGQICSMMYQGLVRFLLNGKTAPDLAAAWDIMGDGRRYVFHLDERMRFSDGRPVRARDVVASFERVLSPEGRSPRRWVLDRIRGAKAYSEGVTDTVEGLTALDETTVVIELESPFRPFLQLLGMPAARVVPADTPPAQEGDTPPIGSGPWRLAAWERGDEVRLEPNPYNPRAAEHLRQIRMRVIPEAFTRIAEFEAGTLDVIKIPLAEVGRFLDDEERSDRIQPRSELRVLYIGLNNRKGPLQDVRVRRALNIAVDVNQMIQVLAHGLAARARGAIPPSLPGFRNRIGYIYNPEEAKRLLAEAGYPDGFSMEIWQRDSPEGNRIVEAVQGYLAEVGVEVHIVKREWSAFKEAVTQGRVDAFFLDWYADYPDAENFLFPLFHSQNFGAGGNRSFFSDPEIDRLIERAQQTPSVEESNELYEMADSLVYERAPWIYLYFPSTFAIVSPRVRGYILPSLYLGEDFAAVRKLPAGGS